MYNQLSNSWGNREWKHERYASTSLEGSGAPLKLPTAQNRRRRSLEIETYRASEGNGNKFGVKLIHMFGVQIYISKQLVLPLFTVIKMIYITFTY